VIDSGTRRFGGVLIILVVAAACSSPRTPSPIWSGDGLHVVDGYWILAEQPCDPASDERCAAMVTAAEVALGIDPTSVVGSASTALPVPKAVRSDGRVEVYMRNTTGTEAFLILDLADGSRRIVGIGCSGVPNPDGSPYWLRTPVEDYRVGATPSH
jgi:hypothetical protein